MGRLAISPTDAMAWLMAKGVPVVEAMPLSKIVPGGMGDVTMAQVDGAQRLIDFGLQPADAWRGATRLLYFGGIDHTLSTATPIRDLGVEPERALELARSQNNYGPDLTSTIATATKLREGGAAPEQAWTAARGIHFGSSDPVPQLEEFALARTQVDAESALRLMGLIR